jgi:hypothetical protein
MAKKKYKFEFQGLTVSSENIGDFKVLIDIFSMCSRYERHMQHIRECEQYEKLSDAVLKSIGDQI